MNLSKNKLGLVAISVKDRRRHSRECATSAVAGWVYWGAGALVVAPMYSKPLVSMGVVAAMLRGSEVVSGACIM